MAQYARIENGVAVERREMAAPPAHKAGLWKLCVDAGPPAVAEGQTVVRSEAVSGDQLVASYTVIKRPDTELRALIKAEAQRRIIAATGATSFEGCLTKQLNAVMRATEITNKRASGQALTDAETAEAAALQALADRIKAIRAASDQIEAALPVDFAANSRWPG